MNSQEAIAKLKKLQESDDTETAHFEADDVLCDLLIELGQHEVVKEYTSIAKWYA